MNDKVVTFSGERMGEEQMLGYFYTATAS